MKVRARHALIRKLTDFSVLSESKKIIALDSDILFFESPGQIIRWVASDNNTALLSCESPGYSYQDRHLSRGKLKYIPVLNSGLICYHANMLDFALAEKACSIEAFNTTFRLQGIDDQQFMACIFGEAEHNIGVQIERLDPDRYIHDKVQLFRKDAIAKHYWFAKSNLEALSTYLNDKRRIHRKICKAPPKCDT